MLNEFYKFISDTIINFFQQRAGEHMLEAGERFCLKVDSQEMVDDVYQALKVAGARNNLIGSYVNKEKKYETITLKVADSEVVIAAKTAGMTEDFLVTLRNLKLTENNLPIFMLTSGPIDSIISATVNMAAREMPFHKDALVKQIENAVSDSSSLSKFDKYVLKYELKRREGDIFTDKSSLYEYRELLSIMSRGTVAKEDYAGFRLFIDNQEKEAETLSGVQMKKRLEENNKLFERIDRIARYGNLEDELGKEFDEKLINRIDRQVKEEPENWYQSLTYTEILESKERKDKIKNNPLQIENDDISIYYETSLMQFAPDKNFVIMDEGASPVKRRIKNILIFNPNRYHEIKIDINCNIAIRSSKDIKFGDALFQGNGKILTFTYKQDIKGFHYIELMDSKNNITYKFKICILELLEELLLDTVRTTFRIKYNTKNPQKSKLIVSGISSEDIIFNSHRTDIDTIFIEEDGQQVLCRLDKALRLKFSEELLNINADEVTLDVNFSGIIVPFLFIPSIAESIPLTSCRAFKEKYLKKRSFTFNDGKIIRGVTQYYPRDEEFKKELELENKIITDHIKFAELKEGKIYSRELKLPEKIESIYDQFCDAFSKLSTLPSLAYYDGELKDLAKQYASCILNFYIENLRDKETLTDEQKSVLQIGKIMCLDEDKEILLSPLHPLNVAYQLQLMKEQEIGQIHDILLRKIQSTNLLPYIRSPKKEPYQVTEQRTAMEWQYYVPLTNKYYRGARAFVQKLTAEKIEEYIAHFQYLFIDIDNKNFRINLINMGDCREILQGIVQYYVKALKANPEPNELMNFEIKIYANKTARNVFRAVADYNTLVTELSKFKEKFGEGYTTYDIAGILAKKLDCYFIDDNSEQYEYAHLTFYEMESKAELGDVNIEHINTGMSLNGILSGVSSVYYSNQFRTCYGTKYAVNNKLVKVATFLNSLERINYTGNPYLHGSCMSTQIEEISEDRMNKIYDSSNWVVFVDPKVSLNFFQESNQAKDLLIIHYSDQYTSSSGYDAITVTRKSWQYENVIREYLIQKGIIADLNQIHMVINSFNALNGEWLLKLISSKREFGRERGTNYSREKMSILSAMKFMLAYLWHPQIIWVPLSLEETLRVSGSVGLSKNEGVLSAKNLGFERGVTSDDLLFVGIEYTDQLKLHIYPIEVKIGDVNSSILRKGKEQVKKTAEGLLRALWPEDETRNNLNVKVSRNYFVQLIIVSCTKMQLYHIDNTQDWEKVLDVWRKHLLNEEYSISTRLNVILGSGSVVSFKKEAVLRTSYLDEQQLQIVELTETDSAKLMLLEVSDIQKNLESTLANHKRLLKSYKLEEIELLKETKNIEDEKLYNKENASQEEKKLLVDMDRLENEDGTETKMSSDDNLSPTINRIGIKVLFGQDQQNGKLVYWSPNDTDEVFHTNTGIIGTMGTGKTQFTKSIVAQLYHERDKNVGDEELGILIFDYKGDYNEQKKDFMAATEAKVYKPFQLPFNPFTLIYDEAPKPLLPYHTANTFVDTIAKVYTSMGAKQRNTLLSCIKKAYSCRGIEANNIETWKNQPPTFHDVYQIYINDETIKKNDVLEAAMEKIEMFQIFEKDPFKTVSLFNLLHGVIVIDLSGYDSDLQNLVAAIILDIFYTQMQVHGHSLIKGKYRQLNKIILVDEADNLLREGFSSLRKILKEGREFGIGTILSTQFLTHFNTKDDDFAKYILTWIVHNVADLSMNDIRFVLNTNGGSVTESQVYTEIKNLNKHYSIVKMGNANTLYRIRDKAFWELCEEWGLSNS